MMGKSVPALTSQRLQPTTHLLHQTAAPQSANTLIEFTKVNRRHQQSSHGNLLSSNPIAKYGVKLTKWHSLGSKLNQVIVQGVIRTLAILEVSKLNFFLYLLFNIQVPCHHTALPQFFLLLTIVLHFPGKVLLEEININMSLRGELENQEQFLPLMQMQNQCHRCR